MADDVALDRGSADSAPVLCPAPWLVLDFDPEGNAHACCASALYPLGNVRHQSIREIWEGERTRTLRRALLAGDLDHGCSSCRHRLEEGDGPPDLLYYRGMPPSRNPRWPEVMAFALNNTCNLQCVQCGGNFSSMIRARRERRAKLVPAYGDAFHEELREFLPHLRRAEFRGGEPFLVKENHRVWNAIRELGLDRLEVQVTTNGTIWNDEVARVLDEIPMQVTFSLDGVTAETNEAIRVGTDQEAVLASFERFVAYTERVGTRMDLSFCVLRQNWSELADLVELADRHGIDAHAQQVLEREHALHRLPSDELAEVVRSLERRGEDLHLERESNRQVWDDMLRWLHTELARGDEHRLRVWEQPHPSNLLHAVTTRRRLVDAAGEAGRRAPRLGRARFDPATIEAWRRRLAGWAATGQVGELRTDADDVVVHADLQAIVPPRADPAPDVVGLTFADALERLMQAYGPNLGLPAEFVEPTAVDQTVFLATTPHRQKTGLTLRLVSVPEQRRGVPTGAMLTLLAIDTWFWPDAGSADGDPVTIGPTRRSSVGAGSPAG